LPSGSDDPAYQGGPSAGSSPADELLVLAARAMKARRPDQALEAAGRAVALAPDRTDAWLLLGGAALEAGHFGRAEQALARAAALAPDRPFIPAQRARALVALGRWREAAEAAALAENLGPTDPLTHDTLGCAWSHINLPDRALAHFEAATRARPDRPDFWFNLGGGLRFLGKLDAAEEAYERAISGAPRLATAHLALAGLRRWSETRNHLARLRTLAGDPEIQGIDAARIAYALFKELDDLGRRDEAWAELRRGSALARTRARWSAAEERDMVAALKSAFPSEKFRNPPPGLAEARPIFIVGLPRSGTTLVEMILGRHSRVRGMGELQTFPLLVKRASAVPGARLLDAATAAALPGLDWATLGRAYLKETAFLAGDAPHATDKLPQNYYQVGAIRLAFPNASIIHVRRAPMDSLFGAYKLLFGRAYDYSYDLDDLADHYLAYRDLMEHWRSVLGDGLIEVRYEDLTAEPEREIRRLLNACGLPFEEACLSPHAAEGAVLTASAVQVRRPIHREGIGAWRHYATGLEPLRRRLEEAGIVDASGDPVAA